MDNAIITAIRSNKLFEPRAIAAVIATETSGRGFDSKTGKIIIRFEPNHFNLLSKQPIASTNQNSQQDSWDIFNKAYAINKEAAMQATSIGLGQILGINYKMIGYKSVDEMWDDAKTGIPAQVNQLIRYINSRPVLAKAIKKHSSVRI